MVISIVIDSDRIIVTSIEKKSISDENWMRDMYLNVELPEMAKNVKFWTFQAKPVWVRVISSSILYDNVVLEKFQW